MDIAGSAYGPRCGSCELKLPATQTGSSIMPGGQGQFGDVAATNMVIQVEAQVPGQ